MAEDCRKEMTLEGLLNALLVQDGNGVIGLNTVSTYENCESITKPGCCGGEVDLLTLLKKITTFDSCGRLAINLIKNIDDNIES